MKTGIFQVYLSIFIFEKNKIVKFLVRNFLVKYQYILEGYDKDWSPPSNKSSASFGNIYEGTYTFKLKARSPEGVWSEPVTYTFRVLPNVAEVFSVIGDQSLS